MADSANVIRVGICCWTLFPAFGQAQTGLPLGFSPLANPLPNAGSYYVDSDPSIPLGGKTPLILIHGISLTSDLPSISASGWNNFCLWFYSNPSIRSRFKIYRFVYKSNQVSVHTLGNYLAQLLNANDGFATDQELAGKDIVVLAHSMGGLVARWFMEEQRLSKAAKWNQSALRLVTLGTPHHGTPAANRCDYVLNPLPDYIGALGYKFNHEQGAGGFAAAAAGFSKLDGIFQFIPSYDEPNRWDLLWDNYDGLFTSGFSPNELNPPIEALNSISSAQSYDSKITAYAGSIANGSFIHTGHDFKLSTIADVLANGLGVPSDGIVPIDSAWFQGRVSNSQIRFFDDYDHLQMMESKTTPGYVPSLSDPLFTSLGSDLLSAIPPIAPLNLSATAVSSSQLNLAWTNVAHETGYTLERRVGSSGAWSQLPAFPANVTTFSDTGRTPGTAYFYRVRAYNAAGESDYSPIASATTQPVAGTTYTLTIASSNPSSGVPVWSCPTSGNCANSLTPTSGSFASGTTVGVSCPSTLAGGLVLQKWKLDGSDYAFISNVGVPMSGPHTLTAVFGTTSLPPKVLSSLTIEGPSSVDERSTALYKARATYTDSSSAYVDAVWADDSSYASISAAGLLDTDAVSSDRDIEIEATVTAGGVTKTRTKDVTIRNIDAVPTYTLTRNIVGGGEIGYSPYANSYAAGTVVALHGNASDGYAFSHWTGDASGTEDDIEIAMTRNKSVTANFVVDTTVGNINVTLLPALAAAEGAAWKYHNFTEWRSSGDGMTGLSPRTGKYVNFKDIPGWIEPDSFTADIIGGQTTQLSATYREILGAVQVTLAPAQASAAGARWRLDGGAWTESGVTLAEVSTGNHTVQFSTVSGWGTPSSQTVSVARGVTSTRNGDYGPPAGFPIITAVSPRSGPIAGGTMVTIDGANFQPGATVSLGGIAATSVTVVSPAQITAITPARPSYGTVALALTSGGQTVTQANGFSYLNALGSNMELVGQIGGNVEAVAVVGNMVYYGEGPGLVVSDFTNSAAPVERGRIALPAVVKDIVVVNNIAFVADWGAGLFAVDVSAPAAPAIVGFFDTEGAATGVAVLNGIAYVADSGAGLQILNVTNPAAMVRLGVLDTAGDAERVSAGLIAAKPYAFVAERDLALRVIDVSIPNAPVEVTSVPAQSAAGIEDVRIVGTTLYVSDWQAGVKIFDASNPESLVQIGSRGNVGPSLIDVVGNRLYTCGSGLRVADLSVTPTPTQLGYFDVGSFCYDLAVANNLAFAAMGRDGLKVVTVSNPASMSLRSALQTLGGVEDVWVSGGVAFVGNDSGFHTVDVSNPARASRHFVDWLATRC